MTNNQILKSMDEARALSEKFNVPLTDIILLGLNMEGAHDPQIETDRMRFKMSPILSKEDFYFALTNTPNSRWKIEGGQMIFDGEKVGQVGETENDTCDNTYWRRFTNIGGTELTINSNSRSFCSGCEFCGTYNLDPEDQAEKDLSTPQKVRTKLEKILIENDLYDLSHLVEVGVVTGCFPTEEMTVDHLNMLHDVLRGEYGFEGELKYVGSQVRSKEALESLASHGLTGISQTVECFTRRDQLLQPKKRISLDEARRILGDAKDVGIKTTLLYIMGLDNLDIFETEIEKFMPHLTKMPVINTMQEYVAGQAGLRVEAAKSIPYYLKARKIMEGLAAPFGLSPNVWENYRGLWFTKYNGEDLDGIRI